MTPPARLLHEGDEALRVGELVLAEGDDGALGAGIDLLQAGLLGAAP